MVGGKIIFFETKAKNIMGRQKKITEQIEKYVKSETKGKKQEPSDFIDTGVTILNLALSDHWQGGYKKGTIINFAGGSNTGKSLLAGTCMACCANNPEFDNYKLKYYESENGFGFDVKKMFGQKTYDKIGDVEPVPYPPRLELVAEEIKKMSEDKQPFVAVLDSFDAFKVKEDLERKEGEQSYKTEKAKYTTQFLTTIASGLKETNSLLILIFHEMKNFGKDSVFRPYKKSQIGAIDFMSQQRFWVHNAGDINYKEDNKKLCQIGGYMTINIHRTKSTGFGWKTSKIPFYADYGIDDVRANINWLIERKFWPEYDKQGYKNPKHYVLTDFDNEAFPIESRKKSDDRESGTIIEFIEKNNLETELKKIVGKRWLEFVESIKTETKVRKRRFE